MGTAQTNKEIPYLAWIIGPRPRNREKGVLSPGRTPAKLQVLLSQDEKVGCVSAR